ncbi:LYR motif-containing protein 4-like [Palaemon carinicauda]|uniref:LYR motif-containing protein 4-like n=1 Tax=Palaemon carinicauda TaxID=392227 RepID=UPI0035B62FFB
MAGGKREVLSLYKALLRESRKFSGYNYREYAMRRIKDGFREGKSLVGEEQQRQLQRARESLEIVKRQVVIGSLYGHPDLVIEK